MIGQTISHYKILEKLGGGGMGVVYRAHDTRLKRTVALKFLPPDLTRDEETKTRFAHEAQAASALQHNNICNIHDIEETNDGQTFIVMDCYEGETLKSRIAKGKSRIEDAIRIAIQVADGLSEAHAHGIIHRDIKPANIMVTPRGDVKILDFGLAKLAGQTLLTKSGSTIGTAAYMSPEQARGEKVDERTDIWSLGVVLYEMLAGRRPFEGEFEQAMLYEIVHEQPRPLGEYTKDAPDELAKIVSRALEKDVTKRYESFEKMLVDLRALQATSVPLTALTAQIRSRVLRWPVLAPAMVVLLALAFYLVWPFMEELLAGTEPITLLVMPFENKTGDPQYDDLSGSIPRLLVTSLEESQRLIVADPERLTDLLKQVGKTEIKPGDVNLGFELCRIDSARVLVTGVFTKAGDVFTTEVRVLNVGDGSELATVKSSGKGTKSLLSKGGQIDELTKQIKAGIGMPSRVVAREERSVQEVTTSSIDAYNYYVRGDREAQKLLYADALPFFRKAVEYDSTFAMAQLALYGIEVDPKRKADAREKARRYAGKASRRESLYIAATFEQDTAKYHAMLRKLVSEYPNFKPGLRALANHFRNSVRGGTNEAISLFNRVLALDPTHISSLNNLTYAYFFNRNEPERALEVNRRHVAASPGDPDPLDTMAEIYFVLGKLDSATLRLQEAVSVKPAWDAYSKVSYIFALKEEYANALKWLDLDRERILRYSQTEELRFRALAYHHLMKSGVYYYLGMFSSAASEMKKALENSEKTSARDGEALVRLENAYLAMLCGRTGEARSSLVQFLGLVPQLKGRFWRPDSVWGDLCSAVIDLRLGKTAAAEAAVARLDRYMEGGRNRTRRSTIHGVKAELFLAKGQVDTSITYWLNQPLWNHNVYFSNYSYPPRELANYANPRDGLARAYVRKGDLDAAIKEYERITTLDTVSRDRRLIHPLHRYELAKLYEKKGMKEKAVGQYERFLFLWKNADRDRPEPKDAKRRVMKLRG